MPQLCHRPGELIQNRYQVRKILGSGAYGTVYGCLDTELSIPLAVKELHVLDGQPGSGERASALAQFRSEATHLSRLRHPHIVSGHYEPHHGNWDICPICGLDYPDEKHCPEHGAALFTLQSRHYLVMEYVGGPDLLEAAVNRGGKLEPEELVTCAREVASALAHIHARGYVHRDIKPENIRMRAQNGPLGGEAVLLDFGIATQGEAAAGDRYGTRAQRHTTGGGTVGYAPESPSERRSPDSRSDVHALGMTLYHLLTGLDPTDPVQAREMRRHTPADFVPHLPASLDEFIHRCVQMDPEERPQDGLELQEALEEIEAEIFAEEPTVQEETPDPFSRSLAAATASPAQIPTGPVTPVGPPALTFRNGTYARDVRELAQLLDRFPNEACKHLFSGDIEDWLFALDQEELALEARSIRTRFRYKTSQGLETFAQATGHLKAPELQSLPERLNFGLLKPGAQRTLGLRIENPGRGHIYGRVQATHPAVYSNGEWEGNRANVPVTFDAGRLRPGRYAGDVVLESPWARTLVPFEARVLGPSWFPPFLSVLFFGVAGMCLGGLLRSLPFFYSMKQPGWGWLTAATAPNWFPTAPLFGAILGAFLLFAVVTESTLRRSWGLFMLAAPLSLLIAIASGVMGHELLVQGDAILQPLASGFTGRFSAGAWLAAGGVVGALWGTLRRPRDLFSVRFLAQLMGWAAMAFLVEAALSGAREAMALGLR